MKKFRTGKSCLIKYIFLCLSTAVPNFHANDVLLFVFINDVSGLNADRCVHSEICALALLTLQLLGNKTIGEETTH